MTDKQMLVLLLIIAIVHAITGSSVANAGWHANLVAAWDILYAVSAVGALYYAGRIVMHRKVK